MTVGQALACQVAAFLAVLLAVSAGHKALRFGQARRIAGDFAGVPPWAAAPAILAAILGEGLAAALLCAPSGRVPGALLAAFFLSVYLALIARSLVSGRRDVDCGCSFGAARHPLGAFEVGRNAVLIVLALLVAASSARGAAAMAASQLLAAAALVALYAALDQVMALGPMRRGTVL